MYSNSFKGSLLLGALCVAALGFQAQPSKSPSIAFASHRDGNWEIYVTDGEGGPQTRLTRRAEQDRFPLWSPDGSKIAFGSQVSGGWELWVMDADGTNARRLFTRISAKGFRQWSPDGSMLAFISARGGREALFVMRSDGTQTRRLTTDGALNPAWSR